MARPATGRTTSVVRMPAEVADALRARADLLGCSVGETVARLLGTADELPSVPLGPQPQPGVPTVDLLVDEHRHAGAPVRSSAHSAETDRPAPQKPDRPTANSAGRCSCKSPTLSKVVSNLCTACNRIR